MRELALKTVIYTYDKFDDFANEFAVGEGDLLFTNQFLYDPFMKHLNLKCDTIFQERFGTTEPTDTMVNEILKTIGDKKYKRVIAVGGGSVVDIGKILAMDRPENVLDLYEKSPVKQIPLIIVPTTCGTGSEVTNISMLYLSEKKTKLGLVNDNLIADVAVLIPEMVKTLPYPFFVYSAIDALIHAVESYVSPKATQTTRMFGKRAIELLLGGFMKIVENGPEYRYEIMEDFLIGSNYAGVAFGTGGCAGVHAMSFPLGGYYRVPHGESNYELFTAIFKEYYRVKPDGKRLTDLMEILAFVMGCKASGIEVLNELDRVLSRLVERKPLREYGVTRERIQEMTDLVIEKQQRLLVNNYVPFDRETIVRIYTELL